MGDFIDTAFGFIGGGAGDEGAGENAAQLARSISQEGIDELRGQLERTRGQLDPFVTAGLGQLPEVQRGATVGGLDEILGQIFGTETFGRLAEERTSAIQGQLANTGLSRSGTALREIAAVPTDIGLQIEQLLRGRQAGIAEQGRLTGLNLGQQGLAGASNIANLISGNAATAFQGITSDAQRADERQASRIGAFSDIGGALIGAGAFSDPRLKENKQKIARFGPLNLYQWDWTKDAQKTAVGKFPTMGFMADEVEQHYPEYVSEKFGFKFIKMQALLTQLEFENSLPIAA